MAIKDFGIDKGLVQKHDLTKKGVKGSFWGFRKMFWIYLKALNVPFADSCCDAASELAPVRYNSEAGGFEYYSLTSDAWVSVLDVSGVPQTLTGAGAVSLTTYATLLVTTGANALTLAEGTEGQKKFIRMKTDGGDGTLTVTNLQGGTTITFNDAGDFVELFYIDAKWHILSQSGVTVA